MLALPRPSGAERWCPCPASHSLEAPFQKDESTSLEGTAAHWLAALILQHGGKPETFVNYQYENGAYVTDEMADAVGVYYREVAPCEGGFIEQLTEIPRIGPGYQGTPDFWYFDPTTCTLHVKDLKYGWGIVEPFENLQLISYAAGIIDNVGKLRELEQELKVCLTIIQPRPWHSQGPVRSWTCSATSLRPLINRLHMKYAEATGPNPVAMTGPHCRYCLALIDCVTNNRAAFHAVDLSETPELQTEDPEHVATELNILDRALETLKWRRDAKEQQGLALIKRGEAMPGWSATSGAGRKVWNAPASVIKGLGDARGLDLAKNEVITPTQAISAGLPVDVVDQYSKRLPGKVSLKPDGNKIKQLFYRS